MSHDDEKLEAGDNLKELSRQMKVSHQQEMAISIKHEKGLGLEHELSLGIKR